MHLLHLWLTDFRSYEEAELTPAPSGITVIHGSNGEGKTNLIEAVAYLATLRSMRGSPAEALIRTGADRAVVRADTRRETRRLVIEAELRAVGRDRIQVNGQPCRRSRDLFGALQVTVFSPDDLKLVKDGPQERRDYLDGLLLALHPRHEATTNEVERVLKQRNALLKAAATAGRSRREMDSPGDLMFTLDVWDSKLVAAGEELVRSREALVAELEPFARHAYGRLAFQSSRAERREIGLRYRRSWQGDLSDALRSVREDDLRRGVTSVGPHRDELELSVGGMAARTHASQGEQRSLALALRLAGNSLITDQVGTSPVLLLDDVFSELDADRSEALLACLPEGQAIVTTAGEVPASAEVQTRLSVEDGKLLG